MLSFIEMYFSHQLPFNREMGLHIKNYELILFILILTTFAIIIIVNILSCLQYAKYTGKLQSRNPIRSLKEQMKAIIKCNDQVLIYEKIQYGTFWLLKNYIRGSMSETIGCAESITYTTNADYTFLDNLANVVERWLGPISLALYAPGYDFNRTMDSIQYVRNCIPESQLIQQYVTFHIYFPNNHIPAYLPRTENEAYLWPCNCQKYTVAPYKNINYENMYRRKKKLLYPINVGRNVARKSVNTYFILASDLELYPTRGFIRQFFEMVTRNASIVQNNLTHSTLMRVFPLPVFEINETSTIPENKLQLLRMLEGKSAFSFHLNICKNCHMIPDYKKWLEANYSQHLDITSIHKREGPFAMWEPFYVSNNREPWFDERITWEGQYNKRIQNYAMCLMNYEYHVLHPAFLIHAPGIKVFDKKDPRLKFVPITRRLIEKTIKPEYGILYGRNKRCRL